MGYIHPLIPHLKDDDGEPRIWWSWRSLNEDSRGNFKGPALQQGRAHLHIDRKSLGLEWYFRLRPHSVGAGVWVNGHGDAEIGGSIRLPLIQVYLSYEGGLHHLPEREIEIRWNDGAFWWSLWHSRYEWSSKTPKWRHGSFNPIDFLLGRQHYSKETLETVGAQIPLPEGSYPATIKIERAIWKRPRWPWPQTIIRADVEMHKPAPIPGKGENSWDVGDDAVCSSSFPANSVGEAIGHVVGSVMKTRLERGGKDWTPKEDPA